VPKHAQAYGVQVPLKEFRLRRPRQWGGCWAFCRLWSLLGLEQFWQPRLADSRERTSWYHVLMLQLAYRLIDPGSEKFYLQLPEVEAAFKDLKDDLAILPLFHQNSQRIEGTS
jgi:hypothetical protein